MAGYRLAGERPGAWESALTPGMIVAVRSLGSPRPSPDGALVAYTCDNEGRTDIFVVPSRGSSAPARSTSTTSTPKRVTAAGAAPPSSTTWSAWTPS